jgi:surface antigen
VDHRAPMEAGHKPEPPGGKGRFRLFARSAAICAALAAFPLGGCSVSMPIGSIFSPEEDPATGTVAPAGDADAVRLEGKPALTEAMDAEDVRRSQSAIALALDPEGNGVPVNWDNPQSGGKGEFRSAGAFYLNGGQLCRHFAATFEKDSQAQAFDGSACRAGPQNWLIVDVRERQTNVAEPPAIQR